MKLLRHLQLLKYEYDVDKLWTGANYGNLEIFARTSAKSNLHGLWLSIDDQHYCGKWRINFYVEGEQLEATKTIFHPAHQTTIYKGSSISISKTFFLPYGDGFKRAAYFILKGHNLSDREKQMGIVCDIEYPEFVWPDYVKTPDLGQKQKRVASQLLDGKVISRTEGRESEIRVVGSTAELQAYFFSSRGASLTYSMRLRPGEEKEEAMIMVIGNTGEKVIEEFNLAFDYQSAFTNTYENVEKVLDTSDIITPDPLINRAIKWAKINCIREQKLYPAGFGFTNDPPQDVLVIRDAAWFVLGSDYITPDFSKGMLDLIRQWGIEDTGKLTEYILCCEKPPFKYDYALNMNDNTPLFIIAAYHHYSITRDKDFLQRIYPTVRNAANWILNQRHDGLVWCRSEESNAWGICGWRNIIPEFQLSGAVTEVNCECYLALRLASKLAKVVGDVSNSQFFESQALELKNNINSKLLNSDTGFYLLNISPGGIKNDQLSGDIIFPVITGVADQETSRRIIDRLAQPDFWTDFGVRTVPKGQKDYDPEFGARLMGGIWPNLTAWVAYGNREFYPNRMIEAMRNIYRISEVEVPRNYKNVVPGEFPECLHGENFQSRGMALSPWVPPTYLWLAFEGILGIIPKAEGPLRIQPHLPASWSWVAVRNLPFQKKLVTCFFHEGKLFANVEVESSCLQETFSRDVTNLIHCNTYAIALEKGDEVIVFVASDENKEVRLELDSVIAGEPRTFDFKIDAGEARLIRIRRDNHGCGS